MSKAVLVMDMPESCADCQLAEKQSGGYWYCNALHNYTSFIAFKEKKAIKLSSAPDAGDNRRPVGEA